MTDITPDQPARHRDGADSTIWSVMLLVSLVALVIFGLYTKGNSTFNLVLGVVATLAIFSILYKENPVFRFFEHIFIGLAAGYGAIFVWVQYIMPKWYIPMVPATMYHKSVDVQGGGQWWLIFGLLIGLLFFTVYIPKLSWMNRFVLFGLMGYSAGATFQGFMGLIAPQLTASFRPPISGYDHPAAGGAGLNDIHIGHLYFHTWWLISIIVLICTFAYFFFSVEHRSRLIRHPAAAGRYFLMISLGAIFGTTVMGRLSLLIARLDFLRVAAVTLFHHGPK